MANQDSRVGALTSYLSHLEAPSLSLFRLSKFRDWLSRRLLRDKSNRDFRSSSQSSASRNYNRHSINRREFISTLSDVFFVTGGITAITGTLVASFGIFPRNQVGIRLYLEFIGCSMVIVGVLILFASLKLKPNSQVMAASDDLIYFSNVNGNLHGRHHRSDRHNSESIHLKAPATVVQRQVTVCSEIQRMVEHESSRCDSCDGSSIHSSTWIPQDAYGDDHQAAIEAALSTVLAVSTLVGFRAHQASNEQENNLYCCLHHTIQLNSNNWTSRAKLYQFRSWRRATINGRRFTGLLILFLLATCCYHFQTTLASRKFITGLLIGTLLARQGGLQGPAYHPYPSQSHHQQQPLFIIIPSASGKHKPPRVMPAYPGGGYGHHRRTNLFSGGRSSRSNKLLARLMPDRSLFPSHSSTNIIPWITETSGESSTALQNTDADISIVVPATASSGNGGTKGSTRHQEVLVVDPSKRKKSHHQVHRRNHRSEFRTMNDSINIATLRAQKSDAVATI